jgi:hypothetical protein
MHLFRLRWIGRRAAISDVPAGSVLLLGSPAQLRKEFFRQMATLKRMTRRSRDRSLSDASGTTRRIALQPCALTVRHIILVH